MFTKYQNTCNTAIRSS